MEVLWGSGNLLGSGIGGTLIDVSMLPLPYPEMLTFDWTSHLFHRVSTAVGLPTAVFPFWCRPDDLLSVHRKASTKAQHAQR